MEEDDDEADVEEDDDEEDDDEEDDEEEEDINNDDAGEGTCLRRKAPISMTPRKYVSHLWYGGLLFFLNLAINTGSSTCLNHAIPTARFKSRDKTQASPTTEPIVVRTFAIISLARDSNSNCCCR